MFKKTKNKNKYKKIKVFKFYPYYDLINSRELDKFLRENDIINVTNFIENNSIFITVVYWANK